MTLKIYLIRHGETDFVKSGKTWGQNDEEELNVEGKKQIKNLAQKIGKVKFDKIFTSDLKRAIQTAEILKECIKIDYIADKRLREYNPGTISPNSDKWIEKYKKMLDSGMSKYDIRPFGEENIWDVIKRAASFIKDLKQETGNIFIISHAGFNSIFINLLLGLDKDLFTKIRQKSSCLNILEIKEDKLVIDTINDTSHIGGLK